MLILSIDLGKTIGIVAYSTDLGLEAHQEEKIYGLEQFKKIIDAWVAIWKPKLILYPYPTRFYNTILAHGKMMGIIQYIAEVNQIQTIEVQDKSSKKIVIGKGNAKKEDIAEFYKDEGIESEHILDALMFAQAYLKQIDEKAY